MSSSDESSAMEVGEGQSGSSRRLRSNTSSQSLMSQPRVKKSRANRSRMSRRTSKAESSSNHGKTHPDVDDTKMEIDNDHEETVQDQDSDAQSTGSSVTEKTVHLEPAESLSSKPSTSSSSSKVTGTRTQTKNGARTDHHEESMGSGRERDQVLGSESEEEDIVDDQGQSNDDKSDTVATSSSPSSDVEDETLFDFTDDDESNLNSSATTPASQPQQAGPSRSQKQYASRSKSQSSPRARRSSQRQANSRLSGIAGGRLNIEAQFANLTSKLEDFENKDDVVLEQLMQKSIIKGTRLLSEMTLGGPKSPSEVHESIKHAKTCSDVLRFKSTNCGSSTSEFRLDEFFQGLVDGAMEAFGDETYDPIHGAMYLNHEFEMQCMRAPRVSFLLGALDFDSVKASNGNAPETKKVTTPKEPAKRRRREFDETLAKASQHEEVPSSQSKKKNKGRGNEPEPGTAEAIASTIRTALVKKGKKDVSSTSKGTNLLEFTIDKLSFPRTVENTFYTGVLAREGLISLKNNASNEFSGTKKLVIKPTEKPSKSDTTGDEVRRMQSIFSMSAKIWKDLMKAAKGTPDIPSQLQPEEKK